MLLSTICFPCVCAFSRGNLWRNLLLSRICSVRIICICLFLKYWGVMSTGLYGTFVFVDSFAETVTWSIRTKSQSEQQTIVFFIPRAEVEYIAQSAFHCSSTIRRLTYPNVFDCLHWCTSYRQTIP